MEIKVDKGGSVAGFRRIMRDLLASAEVRGVLVLACDANNFSPGQVDEILKKVPVPLFGGIFPEIIHRKEKLKKGTILVGLPTIPDVHIFADLSKADEYDDIIDREVSDTADTKTMCVFVDGLSKRIGAFIESLFNVFGLEFNYIGGGAGSLSFDRKPCLFSNDGLLQDCALLARLNIESGIGVTHGWKRISGPSRVIESDGNIIYSLDGKPAFDVYRDVVENHSGQRFTDDNFFDIAKCYPFGINKLGAEKIVRDPLMKGERGSLVCVGEVPVESYVDILTGDIESLTRAAGQALFLAKKAFGTRSPPSLTLLIDCISRVLFLEDRFSEEIDAVFEPDSPLVGALTLGEIANTGKDYLEFYNKTTVVCKLK
ncbi:MAG: histidine kinase [Proteobacteria bacterium]|nr:histidine kinase [Pseudomonadota bacterium]